MRAAPQHPERTDGAPVKGAPQGNHQVLKMDGEAQIQYGTTP